MKDKATDMMDDPDSRARVEQMMQDHGISKDEAIQRLKDMKK